MADIDDPSRYRIVNTEFPPTQVVPAVQKQSVQDAVIANNAERDFEFNVDATPLLDMILQSDRDLIVREFVRIDENDTFLQFGADAPYVAGAGYTAVFLAQRIVGSMLRVRIRNESGAAATVNAEMLVRSS